MTSRSTERLVADARVLSSLHRPGEPLVLPNAWDAGSARAVEAAGFPVVATGSAAVAEALGLDDGEAAPAGEMLASAARIAAAVSVPVTVDAEAGYGLPPDEFVDTLLSTGAVGCNLEDTVHADRTLRETAEQAAYLGAVREAASRAGVDLVINARVDVFILGWGEPGERVDEAVRRGRAYVEAGADCVYPILAADPDDIAALVQGIGAPVNITSWPQAPDLARLAELGVARVSYGPGLYRLTQRYLGELLGRISEGASPA